MLLEHVCFAFFELEWSLDRSPGSLTTDKFETLSTDAASRQVEPSWEAQLIPTQHVLLIKNPVMAAADWKSESACSLIKIKLIYEAQD